MTLSNYLVQRGKRGIWQLRVPVPRSLQAGYGKRERIKSLGTSDRAIASRRAVPILAEWQAEWLRVHGAPATTAVEKVTTPGELALEQHQRILERLEAARRLEPPDDASQDAIVIARTAELRRLSRRRLDGDVSVWMEMADRMIAARGLKIEPSTDAYVELIDNLADASIDALSVFTRRHNGELDAAPRSKPLQVAARLSADTAPHGESLLELYDAYAIWRGTPGRKRRRRPETFEHDRPAVELFAETVGKGRTVRSITQDDARAFRTLLAKFPSSRSKNKRLANASLAECVEIAGREGLPLMSLTTQAKYLSILSPFFSWLVSDAPITIAANPFDGLHHKLERGENRRPSFTSRQLDMLLISPLFARSGGAGQEHIEGNEEVRDSRYWIPLLCMFTGSRITEVAQLQIDDIDVRDDVPLVLLSHDEARGQFVKSKRGRLAALHPLLIEAGFLDYCKQQQKRAKKDGNRQLFPELTAGKRQLLGDAPARWFRRYLERVGIKSGSDGIGAHSFRHTMADAMRAAGYTDAEFGQLILGHANNSITAAYGSIPQGTPARLAEMLAAAFRSEPFSEVDLSGIGTRV
ncbi:MAG: hypothetical protein EOO77_04140 [Oxalobacteraceae bacterium]|nr:MAG: hypothetical protein EOO77_04140 [Oxalobacteraceae bacterium]